MMNWSILSSCFLEQDRGLEALSKVIGRQKQIALDIGNEVEEQNGNHNYDDITKKNFKTIL